MGIAYQATTVGGIGAGDVNLQVKLVTGEIFTGKVTIKGNSDTFILGTSSGEYLINERHVVYMRYAKAGQS